jgi:hypothetical protein
MYRAKGERELRAKLPVTCRQPIQVVLMNHLYCGLDSELSFKLADHWKPEPPQPPQGQQAAPASKPESETETKTDTAREMVEMEGWGQEPLQLPLPEPIPDPSAEEKPQNQNQSQPRPEPKSRPAPRIKMEPHPASAQQGSISLSPGMESCHHPCKDKVQRWMIDTNDRRHASISVARQESARSPTPPMAPQSPTTARSLRPSSNT